MKMEFPERIQPEAINQWLFNEDTIRQVLHVVMENGLRVDYGEKLGKTILFAKNHNHAEKILEIFRKEYPHLFKGGQEYAKVIDNYMPYAQSAIDEFSDVKKMPQIAISVDMLDTGIDMPEVLNLVFFKKVMSKAKFWQMIGRGTRLCPGLLDGEDKDKFYIFDFCGNFSFFRMNEGKETSSQPVLQEAVFNLEFQIAYKLQDASRQTDRLIAYRRQLVEKMADKVHELDRKSFAVRQHLKYVDLYASKEGYQAISYEDTLLVREEVAPLVRPDEDEASAVRFDALVYGMELAYLSDKKLKSNKPLSAFDVKALEEVLWSEIGTREQYEEEYGEKPLGEFVRGIVGLDMRAAKEAFAAYLDETNMDSRQIYFVNQIVEYIVHNGMMKDFTVLQESPFTDRGSVAEIFTDMNLWLGIRMVIEQINANAIA